MKAKVKATGEIIEVELCSYSIFQDVSTSGIDEKTYYRSELEFLPDTPKGVTIEGWVAVDEAGPIYLHEEKPTLINGESDSGDISPYDYWDSNGECHQVTTDLFPDLTFENSPMKVKITITPIEE